MLLKNLMKQKFYPQSMWAPKSALMAAYSYYIQDYYGDAIAELERFIKVYPNNKSLDYAYYMLAICYYEQIVDEKKICNQLKMQKARLIKLFQTTLELSMQWMQDLRLI